MAIGIEHVEITFAPRGILRSVGAEAHCRKMRPTTVNVRNVEDQPTPAKTRITFFEVQNRSSLFCLQRCKR